ncbi:MAG: hypothetical protein N3B16_05230 [Candidatus Aminicenantes bacterium]|nr:hypothetical protein [Candidatus Aminicenantes bacterium]
MKKNTKNSSSILELLRIEPSARSIDYVHHKTQFHLHHLLTEQRHPLTWNLSQVIKKDTERGLQLLFEVDQDIVKKLKAITENEAEINHLEEAARTIVETLKKGKKIFFYGCGSTGRLAKFLESSLWRPFWRKLKKSGRWKSLFSHLPPQIEERVIGEMTGGDRALISALEGFEDLELIGRLQVADRKVRKGDVVFCITEGGETSSVIGAMLAAAEMWEQDETNLTEARRHLYFVYNNPDYVLLPLNRSRKILENPAITKINLATGPQAITGSTRMQATTIETFVLGLILEKAIFNFLALHLDKSRLTQLGFKEEVTLEKELQSFAHIVGSLISHCQEIASLTELEAKTYQNGKKTTYFAKKALLTVFIDGAERSPTFHLPPLDPITSNRRHCLFQVWTEAKDHLEAWRRLLGRNFKGLSLNFYQPLLAEKVEDPFLKEVALQSLLKAGDEQGNLYDFSFSSKNIQKRSPRRGDLGLMVGFDDEIKELVKENSSWQALADLLRTKKAPLGLIFTSLEPKKEFQKRIKASKLLNRATSIYIPLSFSQDPLGLRQQLSLKMLLNAHSTAVMARLGRVVGNTMTTVNPSNLKLIGRATHLILSLVNDTLNSAEWTQKYGPTAPLTYAEANALLFDCLENQECRQSDRSEVELSIVRALESLRLKKFISWGKAIQLVEDQGLETYLCRFNPRLRSS